MVSVCDRVKSRLSIQRILSDAANPFFKSESASQNHSAIITPGMTSVDRQVLDGQRRGGAWSNRTPTSVPFPFRVSKR